jgi:hypothetical protein
MRFARTMAAPLLEVCKYVWEHHEADITKTPNGFYKWQYEVRHAASLLRKAGVMKSAKTSPTGVWELA